ncbi:NAD-dependent epimerase/dehydratase family protein [Rectinema subterraneum]|jgi:nucleoside-diphosphate-sugar epimerase|uniref:NAD-dependent epimerase/dehydratase family protein n=1 Tax=Rectinema subterraneum TaxID=2653714 RepID=UPI00131C18DA|nr:NAD-dependent epimerase/dehydratase family protein [Rectinema subterraneum]
MKIAILGATSHIAKNLIYYFAKDPQCELFLFARNKQAVHEFIESCDSISFSRVLGFEEFLDGNYDAVINCVGIGDPHKQKDAGVEFFRITEYYDNLIIDYLLSHKNVVYINFSSGAVYGTAFDSGVTKDSLATIDVNNITSADFYRIAKLNSEAKHRAMLDLRIIDLRIFGFFSHFIDLDSGFLLCEMVRCTKDHAIFHTNSVDIIRDYVAPSDLFSLVKLCLEKEPLNCALDVYSAKPVRKSELLNLFSEEFGLEIEVEEKDHSSPTGTKVVYFSTNRDAQKLLGYFPENTSICNVQRETRILIQ